LEDQCGLGLHGIGETQPAIQNILPNGPEFMRVYRFAADHGLPVVLTMESWERCLCLQGCDFGEVLSMFEEVIREFPDVRFMIGHGGDCGSVLSQDWDAYLARNRRCWELAAELDNLWVCSCMPWWFAGNRAHHLLEGQLRFLMEHVGFSKVTWGSDWPYSGSGTDFSFKTEYATVVDYYRSLPFCSDAERMQLLGGSAYEFVAGRSGLREDRM
jgi:predicted TIM-barrel fold metal-dependent hydrolase